MGMHSHNSLFSIAEKANFAEYFIDLLIAFITFDYCTVAQLHTGKCTLGTIKLNYFQKEFRSGMKAYFGRQFTKRSLLSEVKGFPCQQKGCSKASILYVGINYDRLYERCCVKRIHLALQNL